MNAVSEHRRPHRSREDAQADSTHSLQPTADSRPATAHCNLSENRSVATAVARSAALPFWVLTKVQV